MLSKPANPTAQIRRIQVGHSRFIPASFPFPFVPKPTGKWTREAEALRRADPVARIAPDHTPSSSLISQVELIVRSQSKGEKKDAMPGRMAAGLTAGLALL